MLLGLLQLTAVFDGCIEDRTTYYSSSISQARPCARGALPARPTAASATPSGRGEADGGRPLPLAAAAGVRVLAISHTLLPTGVGNGFGRVAKGRRQNDSSGISTILLIQFSPPCFALRSFSCRFCTLIRKFNLEFSKFKDNFKTQLKMTQII